MKIFRNLECEVRGCITKSDFREIKPILERDWGKFEEGPELVIFFKGKHDLRLTINKKGGYLTIKKTINAVSSIRSETRVEFELDQVIPVINFMDQLGFNYGLFSYCYRYDAQKSNYSLSVKFNTQIGDLFELDRLINSNADYKKNYKKLVDTASGYGLKVWNQNTYKQIINDSWSGVEEKPLIINNKPNPLIIKILREINRKKKYGSHSPKDSDVTISSELKTRSNDYSELERKFFLKIREELLSTKRGRIDNYNENVSIIIPTFNSWPTLKLTLRSIENQILNQKQKKKIEVIVVDDGSTDGTDKKIKSEDFSLNLRYIKQDNLGRVYARNLGASIANGRILVFVDSDIILERNFLNEHIKRHHYLENIVLLSFKQNISPNDKILKIYFKSVKNPRPDITKDFRFEKVVKKRWLRMHRHVRNIEIRKVRLIEETNNFKNFGKDKILGIWDLPSMVTTNSVSIKKSAFNRIGGFNLQFKGWGMEDTFLGACLIADGNYIIPCFSTGVFHVNHGSRSKNHRNKIQEFNRNVLVYLDLINRPLSKIFKKW